MHTEGVCYWEESCNCLVYLLNKPTFKKLLICPLHFVVGIAHSLPSKRVLTLTAPITNPEFLFWISDPSVHSHSASYFIPLITHLTGQSASRDIMGWWLDKAETQWHHKDKETCHGPRHARNLPRPQQSKQSHTCALATPSTLIA